MTVSREALSARPTRVVRGASMAAFAVVAACVSHMAAGGHAPGLVGLVIAFVFGTLLCTALAGRSLSLLRVSIGITISQLLLHALFSVAGSLGSTLNQGHVHGAPSSHLLVSTSGGSTVIDAPMLLGHGVATVVTIIAWWYAERSFWDVVEARAFRFVAALRGEFVPVAPQAPRQRTPLPENPVLATVRAELAVPSRRGPPVLAAHTL